MSLQHYELTNKNIETDVGEYVYFKDKFPNVGALKKEIEKHIATNGSKDKIKKYTTYKYYRT